ncbi:MAG: hypothetical protein ACQEXJ_15805 [Myxococcota bacterium]
MTPIRIPTPLAACQVLALALGLAALAAPPAGAASNSLTCSNGDTFPCGIQVEDSKLQKVPSVFKFQARVSQAKLPIGKGTFGEVVVRLLEGDTTVCKEEFQNVEVRDSVLNLEIGRNMSCELDEKIAEGTSLAFQICLGSEDSCLKPVALSTVPYAVKASYSQRAQSAHDADESALAHYAYRASADRDLGLLDSLTTGYFDFHSQNDTEGWLQWTPVADPDAMTLHITGKSALTDAPGQLHELELDSATTTTTGDVFVGGHQTVEGDLTSQANLSIVGDADLEGTTTVGSSLEVGSTTTLKGALTVASGGVEVATGGLTVSGTTTFQHDTATHGSASFSGPVTLDDDLVAHGAVVMQPQQSEGTAGGFSAFELRTNDEGLDVLVVAPRAPGDAVYSQLPEVHVDGPLSINDTVTIQGTSTFAGTTRHTGDAVFQGVVDLRDAEDILGLQIGDESGGAVLGDWSFQGEYVNHDGRSVLRGVQGSNEIQALGDLRVDGTAVVAGGLSVIGHDQGREALFDAAASFERGATFEGGIRLGFADGNDSDLFVARTDGSVHLDDNRRITDLVVEASTRFSSNTTTTVDGLLITKGQVEVHEPITVKDWLRVGDSWRVRDGDGLQHTVGGGSWGTALSFPGGGTVALDANGDFPGGTKVGGKLTVGGAFRADSGMEIRAGGTTRVVVDTSQARFFSRAQVDGEFEADPGGPGHLEVTSDSVHLGGVVTNVGGALQVNGSASVSGGLSGSGSVKTQQGTCSTYTDHCPNGMWATGYTTTTSTFCSFWGNCDFQVEVRCCTVELSN